MITFAVAVKEILMVVYALDTEHPILSSQASLVSAISKRVESLHVITGSKGKFNIPNNVSVYVLSPKNRNHTPRLLLIFLKYWRLIQISRKIIKNMRPDVVFVHMSDSYAAILSLFNFLKSVKIYLWYAHTHPSTWVKLCSFMGVSFLSSTRGSFPLQDCKVHLLGQIVDESRFPFLRSRRCISHLSSIKFCHVGRLDKSKNVHRILMALTEIQESERKEIFFNHYGNAASKDTEYRDCLNNRVYRLKESSRVNVELKPSVMNVEVSNILNSHDVFVHAYEGSLDKALIEATLAGIPVITANREYIRIFGSWSSEIDADSELSVSQMITREWVALASMNCRDERKERLRRAHLAQKFYTEKIWLDNFFQVLDIEASSSS